MAKKIQFNVKVNVDGGEGMERDGRAYERAGADAGGWNLVTQKTPLRHKMPLKKGL